MLRSPRTTSRRSTVLCNTAGVYDNRRKSCCNLTLCGVSTQAFCARLLTSNSACVERGGTMRYNLVRWLLWAKLGASCLLQVAPSYR